MTTKEASRFERNVFAIILVIALTLMTLAGLADRREANRQKEWQRFEDCINVYPSDAVCDSCWRAIFGTATPEQVTPKTMLR